MGLRRNQAQTFSCPLPVESHGQCLFLSAVMRDNMCKVLPTKEVHPSLGFGVFFLLGVSHIGMEHPHD